MISWYIDRLKTMSFPEIPFRVRQVLQNKLEAKFGLGKPQAQIPLMVTGSCLPKFDFSGSDILKSEISVFQKQIDYSKQSLDWHKDVFSGKAYPLAFGKTMSIRSNSELSAKNVWEINRLQFLPHLAYNYACTKDATYLEQFMELCSSWIDSNPYLLGINWYSNIEVNIRLINWFFAWELLEVEKLVKKDVSFKAFVEQKWLPSIYQHCKFSHANPSKFSSANNHLISEYAGLFIAATKWTFKESSNWRIEAKKGLEREIVKQHSNGLNREEAAEYIQFITDFFLIPFVLGEKLGDAFSESYKNTLESIFKYIYVFTDINGNFPKYGDEDDGKVVFFSNDPHYNNFKSLYTSAALLFKDASYLPKCAGYDLKNQILFGKKGQEVFSGLKNKDAILSTQFYKEEGHFIFRKQKDEKEIYAHMDAAPLGFLSIAAHGHSDALAFLIHINGQPIFVDPGTYSYHVSKEWRSYFVSSKAHNTITVDNCNQAKHVADTMWLDHYQCTVLNSESSSGKDVVVATHNGYKGVDHIRHFEFDKVLEQFTIIDTLEVKNGKEHTLFVPFHLHPNVKIIDSTQNRYLLTVGDIKVELIADPLLKLKKDRGLKSPILGWYSDSFMHKQPTSVLHGEIITKKTVSFLTKIKILNY